MNIALKVKAVNKANEYANQLYNQLAPIFAPLIGQKILKVDGGLFAKIENQLPTILDGFGLRAYKKTGAYSISWVVQATEWLDNDCESYEIAVYVANMQPYGILASMYDYPANRSNYTIEEVVCKQEAYKAARKAFEAAQTSIHPFSV